MILISFNYAKKIKDCWQADTVFVLLQYICTHLHARFWTRLHSHQSDVFYLLPNVISGACWTDGAGSPCHYHAAEALRYKDLVVPQYWWLTRRGAARETGTSGEGRTGMRSWQELLVAIWPRGRQMQGSGSVCEKGGRRYFGHMSAGQVGCSVSHNIYAYYCIFITFSFWFWWQKSFTFNQLIFQDKLMKVSLWKGYSQRCDCKVH